MTSFDSTRNHNSNSNDRTLNNVSNFTTPTIFGRGTIRILRPYPSIILVALYRTKSYNSFNDDVYEDLISIMELVQNDPSVCAIVLTGTGPYFSSGADLSSSNAFQPEQYGRRSIQKPAGRFMITLLRFTKIIAAAVNGPAVGIGVTLLFHCDIVHCNNTATFWIPFTRLALVPELCSSQTFIETFGLSKANELLLLNKTITAQTAYEWNLCSKVVDVADNDDSKGIVDPFHTNSLGYQMCTELYDKLLSIPLGERTALYFVSLMKQKRSQRMERICLDELELLDERFDSGQVYEASKHIKIGKRSNNSSRATTKPKPKQYSKL